MARHDKAYVSATTKSLLAASKGHRQARLESEDMRSLDDAAALADIVPAMLEQLIKEGRAIGLRDERGEWRLPAWQFDGSVWELLDGLASALGVTEGWALLTFLETPHAALDGVTPRDALIRGVGVTRVRGLVEASI